MNSVKTTMGQEQFGPATPFFIVSSLAPSLDHYVNKLGFESRYQSPAHNPFLPLSRAGRPSRLNSYYSRISTMWITRIMFGFTLP